MNIIMLGLRGTGGVSTHTKALNQELVASGHEVLFFNYYTKKDQSPGAKDILTIIHYFIRGIKLFLIFPFYLLRYKKKSDILHVQSSGPLGGFFPAIVGTTYGKLFNIPTIVTFHHSKTEKFVTNNLKIFSYVLRKSKKFIVVSNKQKEIISKAYNKVYDDKIICIPNGFFSKESVSFNNDNILDKLNIKKNDIVFLNVAWLLEKKGHIYLINSFEEIVKERPNIKCFVVGKGPLYQSLTDEVKKRKLGQNIFFMGFVENDVISVLYNRADYFFLPSLDEGNPIVMFEALGHGLPFIGTDVGGIPEIITSETYGILVPSKNTEKLKEAIITGLNMKWERDKIREYGMNFTWSEITARTVKVYRSESKRILR